MGHLYLPGLSFHIQGIWVGNRDRVSFIAYILGVGIEIINGVDFGHYLVAKEVPHWILQHCRLENYVRTVTSYGFTNLDADVIGPQFPHLLSM